MEDITEPIFVTLHSNRLAIDQYTGYCFLTFRVFETPNFLSIQNDSGIPNLKFL